MTCAELQEVLPDILEDGGTAEQRSHLKLCSACSELASDLREISQQARLLQGSEEPSPRVWNSIEIALRQEGLIHPPLASTPRVRSSLRHWSMAWLLPAAAAFLVTFGVLRYTQHPAPAPTIAERSTPATTPAPTPAAPDLASAAPAAVSAVPVTAAPAGRNHMSLADDEQLLQVVGSRSPAMRASYEADLRRVNAYIRDAEEWARANPNDDEAQQYLMNAYEQKAMVYQMALDRSLP
jgi:hypothetical protein